MSEENVDFCQKGIEQRRQWVCLLLECKDIVYLGAKKNPPKKWRVENYEQTLTQLYLYILCLISSVKVNMKDVSFVKKN